MLLLDFNQLFFGQITKDFADQATSTNPQALSLVKHMVLTSLVFYKRRYGATYGDPVLACDNKRYWRKGRFSYYKGSRKTNREKSKMDWDFIHEALEEVKKDLLAVFPYKIIDVEGAEADDVIACLTKYGQSHDLIQQGLVEDPRPTMIVSADHDFIQLQRYKNVSQYSPNKKALIKPDSTVNAFIMEHICAGDAGDGIPNICSADNCLVDGIRQKSFMRDRIPAFNEHGIDACINDEERRNFQRNQMLVDFEFIPPEINDRIVEAYITSTPAVRSSGKIFNYMIANRMKHLLDSASDF